MTTERQGGNGLGKAMAWGFGIWLGKCLIEAASGRSLWDLLKEMVEAEAARQREIARQEQQLPINESLKALPAIPAPTPVFPPVTPLLRVSAPGLPVQSALSTDQALPKVTTPVTEPDASWRQKIVHPSVVLILGKRGSGKSALGYRLLELFRYGARPYVVGVPASARALLPEWLGIAPALGEVPPKAIALVDEAYLSYHARASRTSEALAMSQALNLSRQREQTLLFVSQEARQVDRNIASSANVVVFKDLGILQLEFDRAELSKLAGQAKEALGKVSGEKRRWSFVYAPDTDFVGLLENELPTFWKPGLSRLFAAQSAPAPARQAKATTPAEKAARARAMRAGGSSYGQIADALGVTRGSVINYIKAYPYRHRSSQNRPL